MRLREVSICTATPFTFDLRLASFALDRSPRTWRTRGPIVGSEAEVDLPRSIGRTGPVIAYSVHPGSPAFRRIPRCPLNGENNVESSASRLRDLAKRPRDSASSIAAAGNRREVAAVVAGGHRARESCDFLTSKKRYPENVSTRGEYFNFGSVGESCVLVSRGNFFSAPSVGHENNEICRRRRGARGRSRDRAVLARFRRPPPRFEGDGPFTFGTISPIKDVDISRILCVFLESRLLLDRPRRNEDKETRSRRLITLCT